MTDIDRRYGNGYPQEEEETKLLNVCASVGSYGAEVRG